MVDRANGDTESEHYLTELDKLHADLSTSATQLKDAMLLSLIQLVYPL